MPDATAHIEVDLFEFFRPLLEAGSTQPRFADLTEVWNWISAHEGEVVEAVDDWGATIQDALTVADEVITPRPTIQSRYYFSDAIRDIQNLPVVIPRGSIWY